MSEYQVWWTDKRGAGCGRAFDCGVDGEGRLQDFLSRLQFDARVDRHDGQTVGHKQDGNWWYVNFLGQRVTGGTSASQPRASRQPARPIKTARNKVDVVNTSRYPDDEVRALVELARGSKEHGHVALSVKNSKYAYRGRAYGHMPSISNRRSGSRRFLVVVAIGAPEMFPRAGKYPGIKSAPVYDMRTWQEALVAVAAHELMHCQQYTLGLPRSEIEAEKAAVRGIEAHRCQLALQRQLELCLIDKLSEAEIVELGSVNEYLDARRHLW